MQMKLRIAFVEAAAESFGSSWSLLTLITHLDRDRFEPFLICNQHNRLIAWCQDAGIPVAPLSLGGKSDYKGGSEKHTGIATANGPLMPSLQERLLLPARMLRDHFTFSTAIKELKQFVAIHRIDVIHCNNQPSTNRFAYLARGTRPIVQHVRDAPLTRSLHMSHLANQSTHLFSISDYVRNDAISAFRLDPKRISTIYNPIGHEFSSSSDMRACQRYDWGIEKEIVVFGMAGRIIPWKGVDRAISAYNELCRDTNMEEKTRLVIVGASDSPTEYEKRCRFLAGDRLGRSIHILPFTKDVTRIFNGFDLVLHPILKPEGFGRVIIEGMACGAPPLGRRLGALPELIEDGCNGHLFLEDSDLIELMRAVSTVPEALTKMKAEAIRTAARFGPENLVPSFEKKYSELFLDTQKS